MKYKAVLVLVICILVVLSAYLLDREHTASEALEAPVLYCEVYGGLDTSGTVTSMRTDELVGVRLYTRSGIGNSSRIVLTVSNITHATLEDRARGSAFHEEVDIEGDIHIETHSGKVVLTMENATARYEFETFSCRWASHEYAKSLLISSLDWEGVIVNLTDRRSLTRYDVGYEDATVRVDDTTYETVNGGLFIPRDQHARVRLEAVDARIPDPPPEVRVDGSLTLRDLNLTTADGRRLRHYDSLSVESPDITLVTYQWPTSHDDADNLIVTPWTMEIRAPGERDVNADGASPVYQVLIMWTLVGIGALVLVVRGKGTHPG